MKALLAPLLLAWSLAAPANPEAQVDWNPAAAQLPEAALLSIGVLALDAPAGEAPSAAESVHVSFALRRALEETERWGPVRMMAGPDHPAELLITGTIVASDGERLVLHLVVTDATGERWIDREYRATAGLDDYLDPTRAEPFAPLYAGVAADLERYRASLSLERLNHIIEVSGLRYAAALAPDAFGGHLERDPDGRYRIRRLPAADDPILARIERVRAAEHLFVDTVDLQFLRAFEEVHPTYAAWRKAMVESRTLMHAYRDDAQARKGRQSARQRYYQLRELKLHQQSLREALAAFAFEVAPTTLELNGELVQLSGTLEAQLRQWRDLLAGIHAAEVGLPQARDSR